MSLGDSEQDRLSSAQSDILLQITQHPYPQSADLTASATSYSQATPSRSHTRGSSLNSSGPEPRETPSQQDIPLREIERQSNDNESVASTRRRQLVTVVDEDRAPSNRTVRCASQRDSMHNAESST